MLAFFYNSYSYENKIYVEEVVSDDLRSQNVSPQLQVAQIDQPAQQNQPSEIKEPVQSIQDQSQRSVKNSGDRSRSARPSAYQPRYK